MTNLLLILKSFYNLSNEPLGDEYWAMNVYFQYFGGVTVQYWGQSCAVSDLVDFRQRIGQENVEKRFKRSIVKHGKDGK